MYIIIFVQIVLLLLSELSRLEAMSEDELDKACREIVGYGDPQYPQMHTREQLEAYCNQTQGKVSTIETNNIFLTLYGQSASATNFIKLAYKEPIYNLTCSRIGNGALDSWLKYYEEVHNKNEAMKPIKNGFTRAMLAAAQPDSNYTIADIKCFVNKWVGETVATVPEGNPRLIVSLQLTLYSRFAPDNILRRSSGCDWPNTTAPTGKHVKSPALLLIKALVNVDTKNKLRRVEAMTEDELDKACRAIVGYGDPEYPQMHTREQLEAYCNQTQSKVSTIETNNIFLSLYGQSASATNFIKLAYKEPIYNLTCSRIANGTLDKWLDHYQEVHNNNGAMKPIKDGFTRAMLAATKPDSNYTINDIKCFVNKWVGETVATVPEGNARLIVSLQLTLYSRFAPDNIFRRSSGCDWPNTPVPTGKHVKSPALLLIKALVNLDRIK